MGSYLWLPFQAEWRGNTWSERRVAVPWVHSTVKGSSVGRKQADTETSPPFTNVSAEVRSTRISTVLTPPGTDAGCELQATERSVRMIVAP